MQSSFQRHILTPREPRNRLFPGVTQWRVTGRHRARSIPTAVPTPEIPAAAKDFARQTRKFEADANQQEVLAAKALRQAAELLEKVIAFARFLDLPIHRVPHHPESLLLPNGSRIIALPGQPASLRGFSAVSLLVIDEAAYVPDQLYNSLRPTLATTNGYDS